MPLSTPLWLEVAKENNLEASFGRATMAPVSPLQWGPNSDRPYASTNHSSRLRSSRSLFVSASRNGSEAVGRWGLTWSGILFLHLKIKPNQQTHRYWHFFFKGTDGEFITISLSISSEPWEVLIIAFSEEVISD